MNKEHQGKVSLFVILFVIVLALLFFADQHQRSLIMDFTVKTKHTEEVVFPLETRQINIGVFQSYSEPNITEMVKTKSEKMKEYGVSVVYTFNNGQNTFQDPINTNLKDAISNSYLGKNVRMPSISYSEVTVTSKSLLGNVKTHVFNVAKPAEEVTQLLESDKSIRNLSKLSFDLKDYNSHVQLDPMSPGVNDLSASIKWVVETDESGYSCGNNYGSFAGDGSFVEDDGYSCIYTKKTDTNYRSIKLDSAGNVN